MPQIEVHTVSCEEAQSFIYDAGWGMAKVDPDGVYQWVNPAYCEILNAPAGLIVGTNYRKWTHPDDLGQYEQLAGEVKAGLRSGYQYSKRYIQRGSTPENKRIVWGLLSVVGQWDADKNFVGYLVQFQPYDHSPSKTTIDLRQIMEAAKWVSQNWKMVLILVAVASGLILGNWGPLYRLLEQSESSPVSEQLPSPPPTGP